MKRLKHSKYKNTGILFEILVRKLTSEALTSDEIKTANIIKKYFNSKTEIGKELQLYNSILREQFKNDARALDFIETCRKTHRKLNKTKLRTEKHNLVREIFETYGRDVLTNTFINNYKVLASTYMLFEHEEHENYTQITSCKNSLVEHMIPKQKRTETDTHSEELRKFESQEKETRLLTLKLLIDNFNKKYSITLNKSQKELLKQYITHVNDTSKLNEYIKQIVPKIKTRLTEHTKKITDPVTKIKVQKLNEMFCDPSSLKTIKESYVLNLLRYYDLIQELDEVHK